MTEIWMRLSRTEGDYIYHDDENLESYLKATDDGKLLKYMDSYKMHVSKHGGHLFLVERYGDLDTCSNTLELEVDSPYLIPGDKKGKELIRVLISFNRQLQIL